MTIIDSHVRFGVSRDVTLHLDGLLESMESCGVDVSIVSPSESQCVLDNELGNSLTTEAARQSNGRVLAYAVASPWHGAHRAFEILSRARDDGAVGLFLDPTLQGFDPFDGMALPLLEFAANEGWFVHVRTGTPPHATPLVVASLARRFPEVPFVMGRMGATDFWTDVIEALRYAPNLYGETVYNPWDLTLDRIRETNDIGTARLVFGSDSPYSTQLSELHRLRSWPLPDAEKQMVLGGTIQQWIGTR